MPRFMSLPTGVCTCGTCSRYSTHGDKCGMDDVFIPDSTAPSVPNFGNDASYAIELDTECPFWSQIAAPETIRQALAS